MTIEEQIMEREWQQANNQYQGTNTIGRSAFTSLIANPLIDSAVINSSSKGNINTFLGAMDSGIYRNNTILGGNFLFGDETIFDKGRFGKKFKAFRDSIGTKISEFGNFTIQRVGADAHESAGLMTDAFKATKVQADHVLESGFGFSKNYTSFFKRLSKYKNDVNVVQNGFNGQTMTRSQMIKMASDKTTRANVLSEMKRVGAYSEGEMARISNLNPESFSAEMNKFANNVVGKGKGDFNENVYNFYNKVAGFGNDELANVDNARKVEHFKKIFSNMSSEELSGFQADLAKTGVKTKAVMSSSEEEALTAMRKAFNSGSKEDAIAAMKYLNTSEISNSVLMNFDSKNINENNIGAVKNFLIENGYIKNKNVKNKEVRKYVEKVAKYSGKNKANNKDYVRLARVIQNGSEEITEGQAHAMINSDAFKKKMSRLASKATRKEAAEELGEKVIGKFMEKTIFEEIMSNKAVQVMTGNVATGALGFGLNVAGAVVGTMASMHSEAAINNFSDVMTYRAIKGEHVTNQTSAMSSYGHSGLSYSNDQDLYNILSSDNMADRYRKDIDPIDIDDRGGKLSDFLVY